MKPLVIPSRQSPFPFLGQKHSLNIFCLLKFIRNKPCPRIDWNSSNIRHSIGRKWNLYVSIIGIMKIVLSQGMASHFHSHTQSD